jgi:hypothetical protein
MLNRCGKIFDVVVDGILPGQHDVFVFIPLAVVSLVMGMNGSSIHFVLLALSLACFINMRLLFGSIGHALATDVIEHMHEDPSMIKENLRSGWSNSALVSALFLTICVPMVQSEAPENASEEVDFLYRMCSCVAVAFSLMGVLQPVFALLYTDHLSAIHTVRFMFCHTWCLGNPMGCTASGFLWTLIALCVWLYGAHGSPALVFSTCITLWASWNFLGATRAFSKWHPTSPIPKQAQSCSCYKKMAAAGVLEDPVPENRETSTFVIGHGSSTKQLTGRVEPGQPDPVICI